MIRLLSFFILFFLFVFAEENEVPDFTACYLKNRNALHQLDGKRAVAVGMHELLVVGETGLGTPRTLDGKPAPIQPLKYDPFLRLSLYGTQAELEPVSFRKSSGNKLGRELGFVTEGELWIGTLEAKQRGLNHFARFSDKTVPSGVVGIKCASSVGIGVGGEAFIETDYILHFLSSPETRYGDVGARFTDRNGRPVVLLADPYFPGTRFRPGDVLLEVDGQPVRSGEEIEKRVLFAKRGERIAFKVERSGVPVAFTVTVGDRLGGGYLSDTFFERFGVYLDDALHIVRVPEEAPGRRRGFRPGDRILAIDKIPVSDVKTLRGILAAKESPETSLLMERDDFQFFLTIPDKKADFATGEF